MYIVMTSKGGEAYRLYRWAYKVGRELLEARDGEKLLTRLIYDLRGEDLPGKFRDTLVKTLHYFSTARGVEALKEIEIPDYILTFGEYGDKFYYMKSAILIGLMNALSRGEKEV